MGWLTGWSYRKSHVINATTDAGTNYQVKIKTYYGIPPRYYDLSDKWTTITGNPTDQHAVQPVHNTTIVECNKVVDGAARKYLAYDSDSAGSQIRLFYTDDLDGQWTPYSGNPILSGANHYRWPSVAYVNGVFHMFLTDVTDGTLERWTSTDGINFTFQENVIVGGNPWKSPFVWFNPNDNKWYLYYHDVAGTTEYIKVRSATNIEDLDTASSSVIMSKDGQMGASSMMYRDGYYWLIVEVFETVWKIRAFYSTSPTSGFVECSNSPILTNDEACGMHFLSPDGSKAHLFSNRDSANWYQDTRKIYSRNHDENVELGTHCRTDFGDVCFTKSDGSTLLDYWMEEKVDGDYAIFWVEVADDLSTNPATIYCYTPDTDIMTEKGWLNLKDFVENKMNLKVATLNPEAGKVEYHYPLAYVKLPFKGKIIHFKSKFFDLKVTPEHRMWYKTRSIDKWRFGVAS
jgi:hypothetical protein